VTVGKKNWSILSLIEVRTAVCVHPFSLLFYLTGTPTVSIFP
jgi:hypothetical protein